MSGVDHEGLGRLQAIFNTTATIDVRQAVVQQTWTGMVLSARTFLSPPLTAPYRFKLGSVLPSISPMPSTVHSRCRYGNDWAGERCHYAMQALRCYGLDLGVSFFVATSFL